MDLSVLDSSPVLEQQTARDAYQTSLDLAVLADSAGYARYWATELHGAAMTAGAVPEIVMARAAAATRRIRVGAGAALMNHRSAYRTAEAFTALHAMFPDRIDLGIGRATAGPVVDTALQQNRSGAAAPYDHAQQVTEVLGWLDHQFDDHPFADVAFFAGLVGGPRPWLLGSTTASAALAAQLGLPYAYASFLSPSGAHSALDTYRTHFRPSPFPSGISRPHTMIALNVTCAPTESEAARSRASADLIYREAARGRRLDTVPGTEDAVAALGGVPRPSAYAPGRWPTTISAAPERLRGILEAMAEETGADEIILQDFIGSPEDRLRSYTLISKAFELAAEQPAARQLERTHD
ncbi:MsnO8 family LLM class oxidoreductase [Streptomyces sp. NPDC001982]|uniref:MsnO8 family LLM class oxidoreductase n=1 Tax=Streptomyces sp. NPDC001982 TaxID=3154405 RepID=UPI00331BF48F